MVWGSDPIPGPEERVACSQFCAYVAFSMFVVPAPTRQIGWASDQTEFVVICIPCVVCARTIHDVRVCSQLHFRLRIRDFTKG